MNALPMLASPSTGAGNRTPLTIESLAGTHVFDLKLDGIRAMATINRGELTLTNRIGTVITHKFPEIALSGDELPFDDMWLDGEIVADDGRFETANTRDKQESSRAIISQAQAHPCRFVAFDVPRLATKPWVERREVLELLAAQFPEGSRFDITPVSEDPGFLQKVAELGMEGVIAKRKSSKYQFGARSRDWVKFKLVQRVSCVVTGYTMGTGSRAHFGAMQLAMIAPNGDIVPVGRVGTGFTQHQIEELKQRLDRAEILVVEIECLNRTSGNQLRFPVYRGIRTDVDVLSASIDQLESLPAC